MKYVAGIFALLPSVLFYACSSSDEKPPAGTTNTDAAVSETSTQHDGGVTLIDATADADASDSSIPLSCPPVASTIQVGLACSKMGAAGYRCSDSQVIGYRYQCPDEASGMVRPSGMCVEIARNDAAKTTDYVCEPVSCPLVNNDSCSATTQYQITCPVGTDVEGKTDGCDVLTPPDAATSETVCCAK